MADEEVKVKFGADTTGLDAGADHVKEKLKDTGSTVHDLRTEFSELRAFIVEAFITNELIDFIEKMSDLGEQAIRTSKMLGMGVEAVQEFQFAVKLSGGDAESAGMMMMRLERNIAEAGDSTSKAAKAFTNLGVSQEDLKKGDVSLILGKIADKFHDTQDGATKTAYAMDLMGRTGARLIPTLDEGSEGLKKMGLIGHETGTILDKETAESFEQTHHRLEIMQASIEGVGITIFQTLKPAIDDIVSGLTEFIQKLNESIKAVGPLGDMIKAIATAFEALKLILENMATQIGVVFAKMVVQTESAAAAMNKALHLDWKGAAEAWEEGSKELEAIVEAANHKYQLQFLETQKVINTIWNPTAASALPKEGPKDTLPDAPKGGADQQLKQDIAMGQERVRFQMELGRLRVANEKDVLDQEVALGQVTNQQKFTLLKQMVDEEYDIENKALEDEGKIRGLDVVQRQKIYDQIEILAKQHEEKLAQLSRQSVLEQKKEYDQLFHSIQQATSQMVAGILQGTQTWQQAMSHLFTNLLAKFIDDMVVKRGLAWAEGEWQQLATTEAKNTAIVASDTAAASASSMSIVGKVIRTIFNDAQETFAGVFAFLSDMMGPAAAGPAAASAATVAAAAGSVQSFAVGSWSVPGDQLANIHKGEMIIPATQAEQIRAGSGGGGSTHITIHAVDAQSFSNMVKNNPQAILSVVKKANRNFNSSVPGWKG